MTDYGEPWNCKSQLWSKRRERLVDCEGVFDRNGDLLADCVMGLDYPENAECMDRLVIDRIVACVNACQGIPSEALEEVLRLLVWSKLSRVDSETCKTQGLGPAIGSDLEKAAAIIKQYGGSWEQLT